MSGKMKVLVLTLCLAFAVAAPSREKRQLPNCVNPFQNVPNPCSTNPNLAYFPHPFDSTKFIQCDRFGKMYIVQCPSGETYNQATTGCVKPTPVTTQAPTAVLNNQCSPQNLAAGNIYFAITGDPTRFIECDLEGNAHILTCPSQLVWNEAQLSCVYTSSLVPTQSPTTRPGGFVPGLTINPCQGQVVPLNGLFLSHPDSHKFIQCLAGNPYVLSCTSGNVWNQFLKRCVSPFYRRLL